MAVSDLFLVEVLPDVFVPERHHMTLGSKVGDGDSKSSGHEVGHEENDQVVEAEVEGAQIIVVNDGGNVDQGQQEVEPD